MDFSAGRQPTTHQANLAKLPRALRPLQDRPQWAVWRWTTTNGRWQKPPFQARDPQRHASTKDPTTWSDYTTALAAVQAGAANGLTYILTEQDGFAAIDLDHCREIRTGSIDVWAQLLLEQALLTYCEITPSGCGLRIWGLGEGKVLHRKFALAQSGEIPRADAALELFRRTNKALTITGLDVRQGRTLCSIDRLMDWAVIFAERQKPAPAASVLIGMAGNGLNLTVDQIETIVQTGELPPGGNRSDLFHAIVGHYLGVGWSAEQIAEHFAEFPEGIAARYIGENRLSGEVARSVSKYGAAELSVSPWSGQAPNPEQAEHPSRVEPELTEPEQPESIEPEHPKQVEPEHPEQVEPDDPPELEPIELEDDEGENAEAAPDLPPMYCHGDPDPRPLKSWAIKGLMPVCGHGLLSGQWGSGKTFVALELAGALMTGQPFLGRLIKRQCGVLLLAAEGADEVRLRLDTMVREKCGGLARAPFRWYETVPTLLQPNAIEKLIAMAWQADDSLQTEFGLPLGLVMIDTIVASAGYALVGAENDAAVGQAIMNVLKAAAVELNCFVLGVDHFGKDITTGTRGSSAKEASGDLVLACLGDRELSGSVINTRLAIRKCRGGPQGQEFPFTLRVVEHPERDEDGEAITTRVVDWQTGPAIGAVADEGLNDPWQQTRRTDQRVAMVRLKRVLMAVLVDHGVDLPAGSNGPVVRMVDREIVRKEFYDRTAVDGTPEQKRKRRYQYFTRAVDWAEEQGLIHVLEIADVTYLWLARPDPHKEDEE
jgi:AAA domain